MDKDMAELEQDLHWIFMELEGGLGLSKEQINTLKFACGFNPKTVAVEHLDNLFKDIGNIFRSNK